MKKIFITAICIALICIILSGCTEIVSERAINTDYITAYDAMETVYEYKWDWWHGDFKYLPVYKMVHHNAVYKVQYEITYSDGSSETYWKEVDKTTYEDALKEIGEQQ